VDDVSLARATAVAERTRQPVELALNQLGIISDAYVVEAYGAVSGLPIWSADQTPITIGASALEVSQTFLRQKRILPISLDETHGVFAVCDPFETNVRSGLEFALQRRIDLLVTSPSEWRRYFQQLYSAPDSEAAIDERRLEQEIQVVADSTSDSEGARSLAALLEVAVARAASDIHIEPRRHDLRMRLRVDGELIDFRTAALDLAGPIVSRIKVLASLDLGEKRLPQDGRATFVVEGRPIETRVSILPSIFGEAAVLRILDRSSLQFELPALGFAPHEAGLMEKAVKASHGIFLVTGPTGSGKTTTLYAVLNALAGSNKKILSIEDPIEYHFAHVVQTQVAPGIGLDFASALRAFLRQDPDVILVGDIRDSEALKVIPRLVDMGVEPYQLAAGLLGAAAQRLVRRLCSHCRTVRAPTTAEIAFVEAVTGAPPTGSAYQAAGCTMCGGTGFKGRIALVEAFLCDDGLSAEIARGGAADQLSGYLKRLGFTSIARDGCAKVSAGLTTFAEVMATTMV
jgi:type II secretory ATPase GspE/PulE/Tfp pilus assembly ATPase PilB-like protein